MAESSTFIRSQTLVSVVIPYHNAADTIAATLKSILEDASSVPWSDGSAPWLQIVCVDNASTDASEFAVETVWIEFASKAFACLVRAHEARKGVSYARNHGINSSKGDYIAFVDADDCVKHGYFDLLLAGGARGVDVVSLAVSSQSPRRLAPDLYSILTIEEFVTQFLDGWWCFSFVAQRYLFDGLRFSGQCYEDVGLFPLVLSRAQSILVSPSVFYDYRKSPSSLTAQSAAWRSRQWDQQAAGLRAQAFLLLPVIKQRIDRDFLQQRMLLRAAAGMVPVLGIRQSCSYVLMDGFAPTCLIRASLVLQKNLVSTFRLIRKVYLACRS